MAGYQCEFGDAPHPGSTLLTSLTTGTTMCACDDDLPVMLAGALATCLGLDPGPLWDAIRRHHDCEVKRQAKDAAQDADMSLSIEVATCPGCQRHITGTGADIDRLKAEHAQGCEPLRALLAGDDG